MEVIEIMGVIRERLDAIETLFNNMHVGDPIKNIDEIYNHINVVNKLIALKAAKFIENDNINIEDTGNNSVNNPVHELISTSSSPKEYETPVIEEVSTSEIESEEIASQLEEDEQISESITDSIFPDGEKELTEEEKAKKAELESQLNEMKKDYDDKINEIKELRKSIDDTMPETLKKALAGELEEHREETNETLNEIEDLANMDVNDVVDYIFRECGIKTTYAGCKIIKCLKPICEADHDMNRDRPIEDILAAMSKQSGVPAETITRYISTLIKHGDFTKTQYLNLKMFKEVTPEDFIKEFIEFYQYDPTDYEDEQTTEEKESTE
jgi:hypothetical protein